MLIVSLCSLLIAFLGLAWLILSFRSPAEPAPVEDLPDSPPPWERRTELSRTRALLEAPRGSAYPDSTPFQFSQQEADDAFIRMANNIRQEQGQAPIKVAATYENTDGLGNVISTWNEYEEANYEASPRQFKKYAHPKVEWRKYAVLYQPTGLLELMHCKPCQIPWNCDSIELTDDEYSKLYEVLDYKSGAARELFFDSIEQLRGYINYGSKIPVDGFKFLNNGWQVKADVYDRHRARGASAATVFQWMAMDEMIAPGLDYNPHEMLDDNLRKLDK